MSNSNSSNSNCSSDSDKNEEIIAITSRRQKSPSLSSSSRSSSSTSPQPSDADNQSNKELTHDGQEKEEDQDRGSELSSPSSNTGSQFAFTQYRGRGGGSQQNSALLSPSSSSSSSIPAPVTTGFLTSAASNNETTATASPNVGSTVPLFSTTLSPPAFSTPFTFGNGLFENKTTNGEAENKESAGSTLNSGSGGDGGGFVFGQNLGDRVINQPQENNENNDNGQTEPTVSNTSQTKEEEVASESQVFGASSDSTSPLAAVTQAYPLVSTTGEEDEKNAFQMNCKLYVYDNKEKAWIERGQGQLRLNDPLDGKPGKSRLIVRVMGSLRLLLNTQIWDGIDLKPVGDSGKCLRFLGRDELNDHQIHVFMIKGSSRDEVSTLNKAIQTRILKCTKKTADDKQNSSSSDENPKVTKRSIPDDNDDSESSLHEGTSNESLTETLPPSKKPHLQ